MAKETTAYKPRDESGHLSVVHTSCGLTARPAVETFFATSKTMVLLAASSVVVSRAICYNIIEGSKMRSVDGMTLTEPSQSPLTILPASFKACILLELYI